MSGPRGMREGVSEAAKKTRPRRNEGTQTSRISRGGFQCAIRRPLRFRNVSLPSWGGIANGFHWIGRRRPGLPTGCASIGFKPGQPKAPRMQMRRSRQARRPAAVFRRCKMAMAARHTPRPGRAAGAVSVNVALVATALLPCPAGCTARLGSAPTGGHRAIFHRTARPATLAGPASGPVPASALSRRAIAHATPQADRPGHWRLPRAHLHRRRVPRPATRFSGQWARGRHSARRVISLGRHGRDRCALHLRGIGRMTLAP